MTVKLTSALILKVLKSQIWRTSRLKCAVTYPFDIEEMM